MSASIWCASLPSPAFQDLPHAHMMITQSSFTFWTYDDYPRKIWPWSEMARQQIRTKENTRYFFKPAIYMPDCREVVLKNQNTWIYLLCLHNNIFTLWIEPANKSRPNCISCSPHRTYGEGLPPPSVTLQQDLTHVLCFACLQCKRIACSSRTRLLCGLWQCVPSYAPSK